MTLATCYNYKGHTIYTVTVVRADESAALAANIRAAKNRPFVG